MFGDAGDEFNVAVLNKPNLSYILSNLKLILENLIEREQLSSNLKPFKIQGEQCFATQAITNNDLIKVFCIRKEFGPQFRIYEKFVIPGNGIKEVIIYKVILYVFICEISLFLAPTSRKGHNSNFATRNR